MPRTTTYQPQIANSICEQIANGASLRSICDNPNMPNKSTIFRWLNKYPDFNALYRQAMKWRLEYYLDRVLEIADSATEETLKANQLQIDSLKWYVGKLSARVHF